MRYKSLMYHDKKYLLLLKLFFNYLKDFSDYYFTRHALPQETHRWPSWCEEPANNQLIPF